MTRFKLFLRSPLFPIFMIVFVDILGFAITIPVMPLYVQDVFGGTASQITLLTTSFFAAQLLAAPQLGRLSDRVGRRPVLIVSQIGSFLALLLSGFAPGLLVLYAARVIDGLTGGNIPVAQAYLSDVTDDSNRASGMGVINAAFNASLLIGPAFGSLVAARFGPRLPFFLGAGVALFTILLSVFLLPEPDKRPQQREEREDGKRPLSAPATVDKQNWLTLLRLPGLPLLMFIAMFDRIAFFNFQPTWVLWVEKVLFTGRDLPFVQQAVGWILTFLGVAGVATQVWLVGPLARNWGEKRMIVWGTLARGSAWLVMVLFPFLLPTLAIVPFIALGGGIALPALTAAVTYATPPDRQGQAIGLYQASKGIGRIAGSAMAGFIFEWGGPAAPLAVAAVFSLITLTAAVRLPASKMKR